MKQQPNTQSKLQRQIQNTNRQIMKNYEHKHSAITKIQTILGIEHSPNHESVLNVPNNQLPVSLIALNDQQILYYSCKYFVIYNMSTKDYQIINKDIKNCQLSQIKKFNTQNPDQKLIVSIYQTQISKQITFLGLLTIKTDYQSRTSRNDSRYQWKVIKLHQQPIAIEDYCFFSKKNLLYFITTKPINAKSLFYNPLYPQNDKTSDKTQQFLCIYDLTKQLMLINHQIRSNTVAFFVQYISLEDSNIAYFVGRNYFRQWTINFNEKSIKQSNVRNVERVLKSKTIVDFQQIQRYSLRQDVQQISQIPFLNPHLQHNNFHILTQPSKLLIILTSNQIILVKNNELICILNPEQNISKQSKNKDNIEKQLENSFNQIHKMKFLFDEYQELKQKQERKLINSKSIDGVRLKTETESYPSFTCISKSWKAQNQNFYFALANSRHNVLIYELVDYQLKLYTEFSCQVTLPLVSIIPSQAGDLLLCRNLENQVHLINQENYDPQDDIPIKSLWGNGQMHGNKIFTMSSPMIQNIMCSVGQDGTFKLWSMKKNQRSIMFEERPSSKPLGITIHPGGTMVGVNFERQIKLFSILPKEFYEITSIKTNYCSIQLKYSERGQFLVSNEGSVLIFYEPFSLKTLGYIEPADLQCRIIDFRLSSNSSYVCFIAEDNTCYFQAISVGQMSRWDHFAPAHEQSEAYTAFCFDFIEKEVIDEKKVRNVFVGATKSKYMVLYGDLGSKLLAEFPIVDCYIVDMELYGNLMFVATSKGTLRVYNWPILEEDLELQSVNLEMNQIRYKPPKYEEYQVWHESIPITKIHRLRFSNQIAIVNDRGNMCVMSFQETKNKKVIYEEVSSERKKMEQLINQMFYIKKSEAEKRNKLIEKTENDILKVENQILREKISLERKMTEQEMTVAKGYEVKSLMQDQQKEQFLTKEYGEILLLKQQIQKKQTHLEQLKLYIIKDHDEKKMYEKSRNNEVEEDIRGIVSEHKEKIKRKIESHKQDIRNKKKEYFSKVKQVQHEFEQEIMKIYQAKLKELQEQQNQPVKMAFNYQNPKLNNRNSTHSNLKVRSKSSQLITNILHENALTTENVLHTDNQHLKQLISKLQNIQNSTSIQQTPNQVTNNQGSQSPIHSHYHTNSINHHKNNFTSPTHHHSSTVNIHSHPQPSQAQTSITSSLNGTSQKQLKRTGKFQINENQFLHKKQQQTSQLKQHEQSMKLFNKNQVMEDQFNNELLQQLTSKQNEDILIQAVRVEELQTANNQLQKQITILKQKVQQMENEDETLQKEFQRNLEEYNLTRFQNLNLHCEVLKMQNQLIQRKQVLENKEEIVMLAYQQKQKLQNYKELVKGSLTKLQQKKQNMRDVFFKKEADLNCIFTELVNQIHKMEQKKCTLQKLQRKSKETSKELTLKSSTLNEVINKLKEIKKYLLLERMNDEKSQKSIFQHEQGLVQTINFLKKRLYMESIKEKKNKQLKKSALNQILKQNKNLLQECNQLRSEGIEYENQIRNLSNKLKDANKMISIETKLKSQKNEVSEQKNQLAIIRELFKMHLKQFEDNQEPNNNTPDEKGQKYDQERQSNEEKVYFDSQKNKQKNTKVVFNNLVHPFTAKTDPQSQQHVVHKPFVLSKYIEAEPFEKIEI